MIFNNKRAELVTIFILLVLLAITIVSYGEYISSKNYIGDNFHKVAYNIKNNNPNCDLNSISIDNQDIKFFSDANEAKSQNFTISQLCP